MAGALKIHAAVDGAVLLPWLDAPQMPGGMPWRGDELLGMHTTGSPSPELFNRLGDFVSFSLPPHRVPPTKTEHNLFPWRRLLIQIDCHYFYDVFLFFH